MKVLVLEHLFPLPLDSGGKIKSFHTIKALAGKHEVHLLSYVRNKEELSLVPELESICGSVQCVGLKRGKLRKALDAAASAVAMRSFIISRDFRREMQEAFDAAVKRLQPDVVHIDHLQMAQFVDFDASFKTVLDQHNVESMIIRRVAETSESRAMRLYARMEWPKLMKYEIDACRRSDMVVTVSDEDKAALVKLDGRIKAISVPIGVDIDYFQPVERDPASKTMLSIGTMYWPPNVDSMLYFCREILPLISAEMPGARLTIAGQRPAPSIQALASDPRITVTGYVDDVREIARDCGVFIVPLRSGSGVRVKLLNAMAMGLPIVSTSIGAEGLDVVSGKHMLIADGPEEFARSVVRVLEDRSLAESLGRNARDLVCEKYSWEVVGRRLLEAYDSLAQ